MSVVVLWDVSPTVAHWMFRFAKNLRAEQISVEILRGKGELENVELNEQVLGEVLELPAFLRIRKAACNRIGVLVPWSRLKSTPIKLVRRRHSGDKLESAKPIWKRQPELASTWKPITHGLLQHHQ